MQRLGARRWLVAGAAFASLLWAGGATARSVVAASLFADARQQASARLAELAALPGSSIRPEQITLGDPVGRMIQGAEWSFPVLVDGQYAGVLAHWTSKGVLLKRAGRGGREVACEVRSPNGWGRGSPSPKALALLERAVKSHASRTPPPLPAADFSLDRAVARQVAAERLEDLKSRMLKDPSTRIDPGEVGLAKRGRGRLGYWTFAIQYKGRRVPGLVLESTIGWQRGRSTAMSTGDGQLQPVYDPGNPNNCHGAWFLRNAVTKQVRTPPRDNLLSGLLSELRRSPQSRGHEVTSIALSMLGDFSTRKWTELDVAKLRRDANGNYWGELYSHEGGTNVTVELRGYNPKTRHGEVLAARYNDGFVQGRLRIRSGPQGVSCTYEDGYPSLRPRQRSIEITRQPRTPAGTALSQRGPRRR